MATKARELPSSIQHLGRYRPPDPSRVTHSDVWRRLRDAADRGENRTVIFVRGV